MSLQTKLGNSIPENCDDDDVPSSDIEDVEVLRSGTGTKRSKVEIGKGMSNASSIPPPGSRSKKCVSPTEEVPLPKSGAKVPLPQNVVGAAPVQTEIIKRKPQSLASQLEARVFQKCMVRLITEKKDMQEIESVLNDALKALDDEICLTEKTCRLAERARAFQFFGDCNKIDELEPLALPMPNPQIKSKSNEIFGEFLPLFSLNAFKESDS